MASPNPSQSPSLTFRLASFSVAVEPAFLITAAILGVLIACAPASGESQASIDPRTAIAGAAAVLIILTVHEFGHALRLRLAGHRDILVRFHGLLLSESRSSEPIPKSLAWRVFLSGPLANTVLGGALLTLRALLFGPDAAEAELGFGASLLSLTGRYSLVYGLLGLLPVPPLDAGLAALAALPPERHNILFTATAVAALAGAALLLAQGSVVGGLLLGFVGWRNWKLKDLDFKALAGQAEDSAPFLRMLDDGWKALHSGDIREAERLGTLCLKNGRGPNLSVGACDLLAWVDLARADAKQAAKWLDKGRSLSGGMFRALTQAMVLEALGQEKQALLFAVEALRKEPSQTSARLTLRLLTANKLFEEAQTLIDKFEWPPATDTAALSEALEQARAAAGVPNGSAPAAADTSSTEDPKEAPEEVQP